MGIEFEIGGVPFGALAQTSGRMGLSCDPGYPEQKQTVFHVPGTIGNLVIQGGTGARVLRFEAQYRAADEAALVALVLADRAAWTDTEVECVTDEGETVTRCTVKDFKRGPISATGRDGVCKCDASIVVESNAGV